MTAPARSEQDLMARARRGDSAAFTTLLRTHDPAMRALTYKLLAGDRHLMDDVLQNAYLQAFRSVESFRGEAAFGTWLHRLVRNACVDELRRTSRRPVPALPDDSPSSEIGVEERFSRSDMVLRALSALPADQRVTAVLVDGEGMTNREAAEALGVAEGTIASRLSRARATLRARLEQEIR